MLAFALVPAFVLVTPTISLAHAASAVKKADCQVHVFLASKEGDGKIPKNLEPLRQALEADEFALLYKGFHLIDRKTVKLALEKAAEADFKSGHKLKLTLLGGDEQRLEFRADLTRRDGKTGLMGTNYSIDDNALIMFTGGSYTSGEVAGKLFFAIQCARRS